MSRLYKLLISATISLTLSFVFYLSILPGIIIFPIVILLFPGKSNFRRNDLYAFRNLLNILYSEIIAGKSFRNSTEIALSDTKLMDTLFKSSAEVAIKELRLGMSDLEVWQNLEKRLDLDTLSQFNMIIEKGYYSGDLITVIKKTIQLLSDRLEIEIEINIAIAEKKFEFMTMMVAPVILLCYLSLTNRSYMSMLFETIVGRIIMTIGLVSLLAAYVIGRKIIEIEV